MQGKITELQGKNKNIYQDIKAKTQRIETLHQCLVYADIIKANRKIYEEWKSKTFLFKDSFYNAHQEEIDKYQRAKGRIEKLSGESALKPKSWKKEMESLENDLYIEIDKAIKRGEKPSVIAKIKKYQEQQEAYEKQKERTKDYHRNEER